MSPPPFRVLVFSKTAGYRHASIPAAISALVQLSSASSADITTSTTTPSSSSSSSSSTATAAPPPPPPFTVHPSEDASVFTPESLSRYRVIVLLHVTGTFLSKSQLAALRGFVRHGRGVVGVHSASTGMSSETDDDEAAVDEEGAGWYRRMVGASFVGHPEPQTAVIKVEDAAHPIVRLGLRGLGDGLESFDHGTLRRTWFDEWYNFKANPRKSSNAHVLLSVEETSYQGGTLGDDHPLSWCHEFEGGRVFHTALGHFDAAYKDTMFMGQVLNGILWTARAIQA
ncbi:hypothetical protein JDV02_000637 [Purpureocillium takamizusanense]|uniref:ThuA-like domain-containing protein n=1 Tax=Purpureocillium takamizusanense TaxID=2060973 RepID=A0A9Q8Q6H7_9HYPO|nr:uncharacterized protein JDV02_000637 [Purpureocillium takamizusanense]UNI13950.1 hypothetical protein JDV02_000637 [Purpureocillium takamizusanense]